MCRFDDVKLWQPLLAKLATSYGEGCCEGAKLLTILRVSAQGSLDPTVLGSLALVPRARWALAELARCREGVYDDQCLNAIRLAMDYQADQEGPEAERRQREELEGRIRVEDSEDGVRGCFVVVYPSLAPSLPRLFILIRSSAH